jgi:hypothetical protein
VYEVLPILVALRELHATAGTAVGPILQLPDFSPNILRGAACVAFSPLPTEGVANRRTNGSVQHCVILIRFNSVEHSKQGNGNREHQHLGWAFGSHGQCCVPLVSLSSLPFSDKHLPSRGLMPNKKCRPRRRLPHPLVSKPPPHDPLTFAPQSTVCARPVPHYGLYIGFEGF